MSTCGGLGETPTVRYCSSTAGVGHQAFLGLLYSLISNQLRMGQSDFSLLAYAGAWATVIAGIWLLVARLDTQECRKHANLSD